MDKIYRVYKPFQVWNGPLLPAGAQLYRFQDESLYTQAGQLACFASSQHSRDCLVGNDDGHWEERGKLIEEINSLTVGKPNVIYKLKEDMFCRQFNENARDLNLPWFWTVDFYCTPISNLQIIKKVILEDKNNQTTSTENKILQKANKA